MFGVRLRSLFTSRWMALLWAALVLLTAINTVGVADDGKGADDSGADGLTAQQQAAIGNAL